MTVQEKPHFDRKFQGKESMLSSQISLHVEKQKPNIPDGGWGWLVVLASFLIYAISEGVGFSLGLLYIELLNEFNASKSATSWIGSLFLSMPLIAGPVCSALVDRYGCKWMTIIGSVICVVGFVFSAYARTIGVLYFTFGVIGGLSRGVCYVAAVVSIAFWFEKKRSIALGLSASGTGFGTIVFAPLTTFLIFEYGWRGTVLITAGIFANMCICGVLMIDPEWMVEESRKNKSTSANNSNKNSAKCKELEQLLKNGEDTQHYLENNKESEGPSEQHKVVSAINLPTYVKQNEKVPLEVLQHLSEKKQMYKIVLENYPTLLTSKSASDKDIRTHQKDATSKPRAPLPPVKPQTTADHASETKDSGNPSTDLINNKDVVELQNNTRKRYQSYLKSIKFRKDSIGHRGALLNMNKYKSKASSCPDVYGNSLTVERKEEKWYDEILEFLKLLTHFSLFLEFHFLLLGTATILLFAWFIVPYFYLAEHMLRCGYTENEASFALSFIGFTTTIGMVFLGWIGDHYSVAKTYAISLIFCGLSVIGMIYFSTNHVLLITCCGFFGFFFASSFPLSPSLLTQLVSLDNFTMAFGMALLCEGIGHLIGPPLGGWLFDLTQSWEQSFYQAGLWIIVAGVLIGIIPFTKNRKLIGSGGVFSERKNEEDGEVKSVA